MTQGEYNNMDKKEPAAGYLKLICPNPDCKGSNAVLRIGGIQCPDCEKAYTAEGIPLQYDPDAQAPKWQLVLPHQIHGKVPTKPVIPLPDPNKRAFDMFAKRACRGETPEQNKNNDKGSK